MPPAASSPERGPRRAQPATGGPAARRPTAVLPPASPPWPRFAARRPLDRSQNGMLSLELLMVLPLVAILTALVVVAAAVGRDLLVLHEGARAAARAAATTTDNAEVQRIAAAAMPEITGATVTVWPEFRRDGDLVRVIVEVQRTYGPITQSLTARAAGRVEPGVGIRARPAGWP